MGSENVDPARLLSSLKDKSSSGPALKQPQFSLSTIPQGKALDRFSVPPPSRKRKADNAESLSSSEPSLKRKLVEESAPIVPLGRSPPRKAVGLLSRRRAGSSYKRIDPPGSSSSIPFSIGAALAGTVPLKHKKKASSKRWDFQIYEDSPQEEMANLMEHSTCTLDISDDEARPSSKGDKENKENEPPVNYQTQIAAHQSPDMMTEKVRTPLGDLEVKEFYAEGCDATSAFLVPEDDVPSGKATLQPQEVPPVTPCPAVEPLEIPSKEAPNLEADDQPAETPSKVDDAPSKSEETLEGSGLEFEIWESGSAKAEEEAAAAADA